MTRRAGLYIHVPFCGGKCPYCDFYSLKGDEQLYDDYTAAVLRAIESCPYDISADTIYFGGGTPTLLGERRLVKILSAARQRFGENQSEITLEANPRSVNAEMLTILRQGGFDRISFGVQSLDDSTLKTLGRRHDSFAAQDSILAAKAAGFEHISADLMLAVPGQSLNEISRSILLLSELPIDHISAYMLKLEPGTAFFECYTEPDEDFYVDCYDTAVKNCREHGFYQYEISNFAKSESAQSKHNLKYWRCEEYLGIGPAAHSFINGKRFYFERDLAAFIGCENPWPLTVCDGEGGSDEERLMLGLRLCEGISLESLSPQFSQKVRQKLTPLLQNGFLTLSGNRIALTEKGFLVSNSVIASLL